MANRRGEPLSGRRGPRRTVRQWIWQILDGDADASRFQRKLRLAYAVVSAALMLTSFVLDTIYHEHMLPFYMPGAYFELAVTALVLFEYSMRVFACVEDPDRSGFETFFPASTQQSRDLRWRFRKMLSPGMILHLITVICLGMLIYIKFCYSKDEVSQNRPVFRWILGVTRTVRILFTCFRLNHPLQFFEMVVDVLLLKSNELCATLFIALMVQMICASLICLIENRPMFDSFFACLWWASAMLTTVGYNDIVTVTVPGKIFTNFVAFVGVGLFAMPAGIFADGFQKVLHQRMATHEETTTISMEQCFASQPSRLAVLEERIDRLREEVAQIGKEQREGLAQVGREQREELEKVTATQREVLELQRVPSQPSRSAVLAESVDRLREEVAQTRIEQRDGLAQVRKEQLEELAKATATKGEVLALQRVLSQPSRSAVLEDCVDRLLEEVVQTRKEQREELAQVRREQREELAKVTATQREILELLRQRPL